MTVLQAIWDRDRLHVWAEIDPAMSMPDSATQGGAATAAAQCLRQIGGECWDPLLISSAVDSRLELRLPFRGNRLAGSGEPVRPDGTASVSLRPVAVSTLAFNAADAVDLLASSPAVLGGVQFGASFRFWSKAAELVIELMARQRFVPAVRKAGTRHEGRWQVVVDDEPAAERLAKLAGAMPPVCRCFDESVQPSDLLESFLLETADAVVRRSMQGDDLAQAVLERSAADRTPLIRWLSSLVAPNSELDLPPADAEALWAKARDWVARVLKEPQDRTIRTCLRLQPPHTGAEWSLALYAQSTRDHGNVVAADELPQTGHRYFPTIASPFDDAVQQVRRDAARAAVHFPPLSPCGKEDGPFECRLTTSEAYAFLRDAALVLESEGFGVWLPEWWRQDAPRVQLRMAIRPDVPEAARDSLSLDALVSYDWKVALGDQELSLDELQQLAAQKDPLIRIRGRWAELQVSELQRAIEYMNRQGSQKTTLLEALRKCYVADDEETGLPVGGYAAEGWVDTLLNASDVRVQIEDILTPDGFRGTLRPYQLRGLQWLSFLSRLGFGACLADDMGLGKTIQLIALLLHERETSRSPGPTLLVVPMSLVGNWKREIERFGPSLRAMIHHGLERRQGQSFIEEAARHDVIVSTYGLIHRDFEYLSAVPWGRLALDEAQNIKNPAAKQSVAVRALRARHRAALTGTPVENHLSELWTIMDFLNQGFLGSAAEFRRRFAVPIERHRDSVRAGRLRQLIRPFVLRRLKSDPHIQVDLPPKLEMKVYCNLTREQAALYQAIVNEMLGQIDRSDGIQRRGLILAALVKLKQVCNHPAQLLADGSALPQRSGKCERLTEMLDEVLAEGDRALIFTQFREMGSLLRQLLVGRFQREVLFLHGGTSQKERDSLVQRFQSGEESPLFVLSLKAGGFGLNLTAANHVFHFDRWWNPAVEDQAADRAHRIGQHRQVQVHKFVCIGTLEERIDSMLEQKRQLAESIIGSGETWITELSTDALREMFALSRDAVGDE